MTETPDVQYGKGQLARLYESDNARVWAEEFIASKARCGWTLEDIDLGLMIAWFANAIETAKRIVQESECD